MPRRIEPGPEAAQRLLVNFMPGKPRSIQADGLTLFYIRYWHPVFIVWRDQRRRVQVRYHPEDLSRVFVSADGRNYVEARYADIRRPAISLWEQRAAVKALRASNQPQLSEALVFKAIGQQRRVIDDARREKRKAKTGAPRLAVPVATPGKASSPDYSKAVEPFGLEIWR